MKDLKFITGTSSTKNRRGREEYKASLFWMRMASAQQQQLLFAVLSSLVLLLPIQTVVADQQQAEEQDSKDGEGDIQQYDGKDEFDYDTVIDYSSSSLFPSFWYTFGMLAPYLFGLMLVIFGVHMLVQSNINLICLMKAYLEDGATRISGTVIDCDQQAKIEKRQKKKSSKTKDGDNNNNESKTTETKSNSDATTTPTKQQHQPKVVVWSTEIMWECKEHQFADNPILKARHPDAIETRRYAKCFEFPEEQIIGSFVPILLPQSASTTTTTTTSTTAKAQQQQKEQQQQHIIIPSSIARCGVPAPVCERILEKALSKAKSPYQIGLLCLGVGLIVAIITMAIQTINYNYDTYIDDDDDENPHYYKHPYSKLAGYVVLVSGVAIIECCSILYWNIDFQREKGRKFDGARSMVISSPSLSSSGVV